MTLPALIPWQEMRERLLVIFPEGMPDRGFLVRDMTARTVFTALYVGAVAGSDTWLAPRHVLRMSDAQAARQDDASRRVYLAEMTKAKAPSPDGRWYAENTREPLRDEVIRQGLVPVNAMVERQGVPTTSPTGRYALQPAFAALFRPALTRAELDAEAEAWRRAHLSPAALARAALVRASASTRAATSRSDVPVVPPSSCRPARARSSPRR
jgi:hypothetical protein